MADEQVKTKRAAVLESLVADLTCTCTRPDDAAYGDYICSESVHSSCPLDYVCFPRAFGGKLYGGFPNYQDLQSTACKLVSKCSGWNLSELCGNVYMFPDPYKLHATCKSATHCDQDECCSMDGSFQLKSPQLAHHSMAALCLEKGSWGAQMRPCNPLESAQRWQWYQHPEDTKGVHMLRNPSSDMCLHSHGSNQWVTLEGCNRNSAEEKWHFDKQSGQLFNPTSSLVLDIWGAQKWTDEGTGVVTYAPNYQKNQMWEIVVSNQEFHLAEGMANTAVPAAVFAAFTVLGALMGVCATFRRAWARPDHLREPLVA